MATRATKKQLEFLNWEFGVFFHFGIRTFYPEHKDWDFMPMPLDAFCPTELDCDRWIKTIWESGAKYAVLVCKHHDGFANWPSQYTDYSVANTPWKEGEGDIVREFTNACRRYGIKIGLYYSPAEYETKTKSAKNYDEYFIQQIRELLGSYGQIDYLWFDGCGSENHQYDTARIIQEIRRLQPDILIFNMWDPDTRWNGNESGYADMPNPLIVDSVAFSVLAESEEKLSQRLFLPVECDIKIHRNSWFHKEGEEIKTLDELIGIYHYSVGRGANLLLNIGPDRRGLLPKAEEARLRELGEYIKNSFCNPAAEHFILEGGVYKLKLSEPTLIDCIILSEAEESLGSIKEYHIRAYCYDDFAKPIKVFRSETIGHKAICRFEPIFARGFDVVIDKEVTCSKLQKFSAHFVDRRLL